MRLKPTFETDAYITDAGYFAIRQESPMGEEDTILLSPEQLRAVVAYARIQLRTSKTWWRAEEVD